MPSGIQWSDGHLEVAVVRVAVVLAERHGTAGVDDGLELRHGVPGSAGTARTSKVRVSSARATCPAASCTSPIWVAASSSAVGTRPA